MWTLIHGCGRVASLLSSGHHHFVHAGLGNGHFVSPLQGDLQWCSTVQEGYWLAVASSNQVHSAPGYVSDWSSPTDPRAQTPVSQTWWQQLWEWQHKPQGSDSHMIDVSGFAHLSCTLTLSQPFTPECWICNRKLKASSYLLSCPFPFMFSSLFFSWHPSTHIYFIIYLKDVHLCLS